LIAIPFQQKNVLVAPLDWGLGHATRCVPIIKELLLAQNKVLLGVTPLTSKILCTEFPELEVIALPNYSIQYSRILPLWLKLLLQFPKIAAVIKKENLLLDHWIQKHQLDIVISDNRYGLFHPKTTNIIICHQINLKAPLFNRASNKKNIGYLKNFHEVWVPDYQNANDNLAGSLSINVHKLPVKYIGPQSRLQPLNQAAVYHALFLLSGPQPLQGLLLNKIMALAATLVNKKIAIIAESVFEKTIPLHVDFFSLPDVNEINKIIAQSDWVICRSGYSTLMDMHVLGKEKLIIIPTPGQTEQEYLASYWQDRFETVHAIKEKNLEKISSILN